MTKWAAFGACAYECAAIGTGRVPTFTALSKTRPWLRHVLVGALAVHLYRKA
jgi:hypothetical protein